MDSDIVFLICFHRFWLRLSFIDCCLIEGLGKKHSSKLTGRWLEIPTDFDSIYNIHQKNMGECRHGLWGKSLLEDISPYMFL